MEQNATNDYVAQLEERVLMLTRLLEVGSVLNSALLRSEVEIDELLSYLMDAAASITNSESASVLLWDNNRQELYFAATTSGGGATSLIGKPVPLDSIAGEIFKQRSIVQVDDASTDPRHYNKVDEDIAFVTRSLMGIPMIAQDEVIGVLEVVNKRELPWTMNDRNNLSILANEAAVAIRVAQLMMDMLRVNEELSELDKLKSDFIAIASHELRTPLGIIMGYGSFLESAEDESVRGHASKVMSSALQLRKIIEDMINLRYLKQKPEDLQRVPISINELIEEIQRDILSLSGTGHELIVDVQDKDTPLYVDSTRLSMAIVNLLNNAAAFTPEGGPITLSAWKHDDNEVRIAVTDTGIGIEPQFLEKIFEDFYQIEDHMTRRHGGLGIGLSITRALVAAHSGRVWASSPGLGEGSTFTVALPIARNQAA
jgi:signal transduction histidine kinase